MLTCVFVRAVRRKYGIALCDFLIRISCDNFTLTDIKQNFEFLIMCIWVAGDKLRSHTFDEHNATS